MGLPKEFDSDDISEPGTIQSVLEALHKAPLTDRQGRELPSLSVDGEGWFKGIDEEIPAVKDLLAEPEHPGGIAARSTVFARVSVVWMRARVSCWHSGVICD